MRATLLLLACLCTACPAAAQYPLRMPPQPNVPPAPLPPLPRPVPPAPPAPPARASRSASADSAETARLHAFLRALGGRSMLRLSLLSREEFEGFPRAITGDTLWLAPHAEDSRRVPVVLSQVARVQQRRSGAAEGRETGGRSGFVIGALLGGLVGSALAGLGGEETSDVPVIIGCAMAGGAVTGMAGSLLGAGVGATSHAWHAVWPEDDKARAGAIAAARAAAASDKSQTDKSPIEKPPVYTRVLVEFGHAAAAGDTYDTKGLELGAGLLGRPAPGVDLGPVIRFHALGGRADVPPSSGNGTYTELQSIATISLDLRWTPATAGWRPWLDGGLGVSLANDVFTSAHLGLGLRLRDSHGHDYGLTVRRHAALVDVTDGLDGWWTAGAVITFSP